MYLSLCSQNLLENVPNVKLNLDFQKVKSDRQFQR